MNRSIRLSLAFLIATIALFAQANPAMARFIGRTPEVQAALDEGIAKFEAITDTTRAKLNLTVAQGTLRMQGIKARGGSPAQIQKEYNKYLKQLVSVANSINPKLNRTEGTYTIKIRRLGGGRDAVNELLAAEQDTIDNTSINLAQAKADLLAAYQQVLAGE